MPIKLKKKIVIRLSGFLLCLIISFPILKTAWVYFENTNQVKVDQSSVIRPHDVARILSDRFSTKRLYQTKGYNSVSIKHIFQHLTIAGDQPPAGLFFNYDLNSEEKFSIEVEGKALQGTTTMRIRKNEESPQYLQPSSIKRARPQTGHFGVLFADRVCHLKWHFLNHHHCRFFHYEPEV